MKDKLIINVTTIYCEDDPKCIGDYCEINLELFNETLGEYIYTKTFGDEYHDKGRDRSEAVVEFIKDFMDDEFEISVVKKKVSSYPC